MMRNTIRTAVSSVAYLRNLFDEEAFEDKNVSGLQLKVLRPFNQESKLILNWLEDGVFDALEKQYLKLLVFGIHGECDELIESYHFHFSYSEGGTNINLKRKSKDQEILKSQEINGYERCTKEYARQQTVQLLRALILLTQSLSPLPESRYMSMKLWYYEDRVPSDYEPNHFRPARSSDILLFNEIPIDTVVGNVDTKFHTLSVKVKSAVENNDNSELGFYDNINKNQVKKKEHHLDKKESFNNFASSKDNIIQRGDDELTAGSSAENKQVKIENICINPYNSPTDDRTIKTINSIELLEKATEVVKFLKFVNKQNLAMALDIEKEKAGNLIETLLDNGHLLNKVVRGKGYPVSERGSDEKKVKNKGICKRRNCAKNGKPPQ
ncbi:HORMA domain-containing protein [Cryptosporidium canis]|uniref:HORMA domain-containing protein n=1 Tax=Cryptosporidium canis TaxID=195482 RepID=A0A9D5HX93_9CRYT|nr:HORMA domain-containing protein [Cryptosporidium canis]